MTDAQTTLSPQDNLALLSAIAQADRVKRSDQRKLDDAKRDIVVALRERALLVACTGDQMALRPAGPDDGSVLPVFTDSEAAEAWIAAQHPAAGPVSAGLRGPTAQGEEGWLELCSQHGVSALAVNPAGPLGCMVYTVELARLRPRLLHRTPAPDPDIAWLGLEERTSERERGAERLARLAQAVEDGNADLANAIAAESGPINRLRSLLWAAELHRLGGRVRLLTGEFRPGLEELAVAGAQFRLAGEPHHAIDTLLEAAAGLRERIREGSADDAEWARTRLPMARESLNALAVTGYRLAEIERAGEP